MLRFFLLLLFSVGVLQGDRLLLSPLLRQWQARKMPSVQGRIVGQRAPGGLLEFEYTVEGRTFRGGRLRYSNFGNASEERVKVLLERYPIDSVHPVYYSVSDPTEAVLEVGWKGADVMLLLFVAPFNTLALLGWLRLPGSPGFRVWRGGPDLGVRLFRGLAAGLTAVTWLSLSGVFLLAMLVGLQLPLALPAGLGVAVVGASVALGLPPFLQPLREGVVLHDNGFVVYTLGQPRRLDYSLVRGVRAESDGRVFLDYGDESLLLTRSAGRWLPILQAKLLRS